MLSCSLLDVYGCMMLVGGSCGLLDWRFLWIITMFFSLRYSILEIKLQLFKMNWFGEWRRLIICICRTFSASDRDSKTRIVVQWTWTLFSLSSYHCRYVWSWGNGNSVCRSWRGTSLMINSLGSWSLSLIFLQDIWLSIIEIQFLIVLNPNFISVIFLSGQFVDELI